jgi:radical SAM/Cys-rich protein
MDWETMQRVLDVAKRTGCPTLDITGGAPEMNPHFRRLVERASKLGLTVMVRTNLTILLEPGYLDLPAFHRRHRVQLVASLPCYLKDNVDQQRGRHTYDRSIEAIRRLNQVGCGIRADLPLSLVYNPLGTALPPDQPSLEEAYRRELRSRFGIAFTRLYTITNMPIGRFLHELERDGKTEDYLELLQRSFNPLTLEGLMCRHQLHVGWDGTLYDCDFNFALGLPVQGERHHIRDFDPQTFVHRRIATGNHCFGCTAGHGSSCTGALADEVRSVSEVRSGAEVRSEK